jgi:hypothetical protein
MRTTDDEAGARLQQARPHTKHRTRREFSGRSTARVKVKDVA